MNKRTEIICATVFLCCFAGTPIFTQETATPDSLMNGKSQKKMHIKLWGELYNESVSFYKLNNNFISFSHIRQGLKMYRESKICFETYFLFRYGKDLDKDFWNNKIETGLGFRLRWFQKIFLAVYLEWIKGHYIDMLEEYALYASENYHDFRTGLIFWYGWDRKIIEYPPENFPLNYWGELYSDVSYYRSQRNNVIGYFSAKIGLRPLKLWHTTLDCYGTAYLSKDVNKDFWNNKIEYGPGFWIRPYYDLSLKLYIEWLWGNYFGIEGLDPNPYDQNYWDRRMGIIFWIGW